MAENNLEQKIRELQTKKISAERELQRLKDQQQKREEDKVKKLLSLDGPHLTEKQKEDAFWTWIWCNADIMFPEAKRFLGNSDTELDFWELLHPDKVKENMEQDEPEKLGREQTTRLMAEVIEWGIIHAAKVLGKDPYWLHETPEKLRQKLIEKTADGRYD